MDLFIQAAKWLLVPALITLALLGGARLIGDIAEAMPTRTGAVVTTCQPVQGEMFNRCAKLDTTQVTDLR